jgi:hypothetical protein
MILPDKRYDASRQEVGCFLTRGKIPPDSRYSSLQPAVGGILLHAASSWRYIITCSLQLEVYYYMQPAVGGLLLASCSRRFITCSLQLQLKNIPYDVDFGPNSRKNVPLHQYHTLGLRMCWTVQLALKV